MTLLCYRSRPLVQSIAAARVRGRGRGTRVRAVEKLALRLASDYATQRPDSALVGPPHAHVAIVARRGEHGAGHIPLDAPHLATEDGLDWIGLTYSEQNGIENTLRRRKATTHTQLGILSVRTSAACPRRASSAIISCLNLPVEGSMRILKMRTLPSLHAVATRW